jgi:SAM-dependent methyltransferase
MSNRTQELRASFDSIAVKDDFGWDNSQYFYDYLIARVPANCENALDVGCGRGGFTRRLANTCCHVTGVDYSKVSIEQARAESTKTPNIDVVWADLETWHWPIEKYGFISAIATMHHLPLAGTLWKMRCALRPGGVLVILDLFETQSFSDNIYSLLSFPLSRYLRFRETGRFRVPKQVRWLWDKHSRLDQLSTLPQIRAVTRQILPGAEVRRHMLRRYSIRWTKAAASRVTH